MIRSKQWDLLVYKKPKLDRKSDDIGKIIGFDSEAYSTGEPFLFCTELGDSFTPENLIPSLFTEKYNRSNFVLWNMKYDSGAILYHLPDEVLKTLWEFNEAEHESLEYKYIPHKQLKISKSKSEFIIFWDIAQFYKSSLNSAAKTYLKKTKLDIATKTFSPKYVARFNKAITKYCIQDAALTGELGRYLVDKLKEFGINTSALYSCASISFKYFNENSTIITSWNFYNKYPEVLKFACDAYRGGKFEVTAKGYFPDVYEYDLTSAYPYEIANLIDITNAEISHTQNFQPSATYGFIRCKIDNTISKHIPCGVVEGELNKNSEKTVIYPSGIFETTITKEEYIYITSIGVGVTIIDGIYLFVNKKTYPYKEVIEYLYTIKDVYKGKDRLLYSVCKILMNSFYGKLCQTIKDPGGEYIAGMGWNPIYAAIITANTRITVTKIQNDKQSDCIAVHTDSVMVTSPISQSLITKALGSFEYVTRGPAIVIACGMYQINDICAYKGFLPPKKKLYNDDKTPMLDENGKQKERFLTWEEILSKNCYRKKSKITLSQLHVESWLEAQAKGHEKNKINLFEIVPKIIDLNGDVKRIWDDNFIAKDFLKKNIQSTHKFIFYK